MKKVMIISLNSGGTMAHGTIMPKEFSSKRPIYINQINSSGFDYIALGHFHDFYEVPSKISCYYSGSPVKSLSYKNKKRSILMIRISRRRIKIKKIFLN